MNHIPFETMAEEIKRKNKIEKLKLIGLSFLIVVALFFLFNTVFNIRWKHENYEYENLRFEYVDDYDKYEIYIPEHGYFMFPRKATEYVYAPLDDKCWVKLNVSNFWWTDKYTEKTVTKFIINIAYMPEVEQ